MTTYTILTAEGEIVETGLSLGDAAAEVLTSDSREFDIRETEDGCFTLWTRQQVANRRWGETRFFSFASTRANAECEIFEKVINSERFTGHCEAITNEQYQQMLANLEEDA